jgi:hydrogenase/urease accessory protein HupE
MNADTADALKHVLTLIEAFVPKIEDQIVLSVALTRLCITITRDLQASVMACLPEEPK